MVNLTCWCKAQNVRQDMFFELLAIFRMHDSGGSPLSICMSETVCVQPPRTRSLWPARTNESNVYGGMHMKVSFATLREC